MRMFSKHIVAALLGAAVFSSCSRPVAYFQPSAREHFATTPAKVVSITPTESAAPVVAQTPVTEAVATPSAQVAQTTAALDQVDAMVRNDSKLSADKTVQKRLNKVRTLLAANSAKATLTPTEVNAPKKMNLMERMMLKKINKKISKQLAPANPEKTMVNSGTLAGGAVLVIVGLLLLILTSGTAATVGLVAVLVGAVILLIGLL
ncbi:hypothetical protein [Spirosoma radiotolerans]|uniref:Lipoprotein n=1 Tax=Spirosoma radiotolerans TaxID=1379870 RepID=A0A0E3ZT48_9BACT|nr:hypothetical protein [Spirosoma radiotolerans]AKD54714.1 hypothetical protein SD10_07120 [Spirosoma radiotolerans]